MREHIAYYEVEKRILERTQTRKFGKKYTVKEHMSSKSIPWRAAHPCTPTYGSAPPPLPSHPGVES